jgi:hypothetical protein
VKIEPSLIVAFVRFRHQFVGHEFASVGLGQPSADGRPFVIRHDVDTGTARLDFARIFSKLFLVFLRPGFRLPDSISEHFDHHENQYTTGPVTGNHSIHYH